MNDRDRNRVGSVRLFPSSALTFTTSLTKGFHRATSLRTRVAQWVTDSLHNGSNDFMQSRASRLLLRELRSLMARQGDPLIRFNLDGVPLLLPLSHDLPRYRSHYPEYSENLGRIAAAVFSKYPNRSFVDIGANVGDSAAIVRRYAGDLPILAIEGNLRFLSVLEQNASQLGELEIEPSFLDRENAARSIQIVTGRGSAHLQPVKNGRVQNLISLKEALDRHPRFADPALVKIDTDGMDIDILLGAKDVLGEVMPALFFEFDPKNRADGSVSLSSFVGTMHDLGYRHCIVYDNYGSLMRTCVTSQIHEFRTLEQYLKRESTPIYCDMCLLSEADDDVLNSILRQESEFLHDGDSDASKVTMERFRK